jgi:hypothetical protein
MLKQVFGTVDAALIIIGNDLGQRLPGEDARLLPLEVEVALQANVPLFVYVSKNPDADIPLVEDAAILSDLVSELSTRSPVRHFQDAAELATLLIADLTRFLDERVERESPFPYGSAVRTPPRST